MKGKKRNRSTCSSNLHWTGADHAIREDARLCKKKKQAKCTEKERRRLALTHETPEKRDALKLRLHLTKTQRQVDQLKERLQRWDAQEEKEREEEERKKKALEEEKMKQGNKRRNWRKGPETWKLRGPARPAWQSYDFDTRYECPHAKAHKEAKEKARRCINLLAVYKGRFSRGPGPCREYLGLLMQLGHLRQESRQFKSAREAWLECMELEGDDLGDDCRGGDGDGGMTTTSSRECLMRMYIELQRFDAAYRLGGERLKEDPSVWIRYGTALIAMQQKKEGADRWIVRAIRANPFCAFYLAFYETFTGVMEYTDEIENSEYGPQTSLEEALEYCSSDQAQNWQTSSDALIALRSTLLRAVEGIHEELSASDVDWCTRLGKIEAELPELHVNKKQPGDGRDHDNGEAEDSTVDVHMFVGMFRTAMEMVQASGELSKTVGVQN